MTRISTPIKFTVACLLAVAAASASGNPTSDAIAEASHDASQPEARWPVPDRSVRIHGDRNHNANRNANSATSMNRNTNSIRAHQDQSQSMVANIAAGNNDGNVRNAGNNTGNSASKASQRNTNSARGNTTTTTLGNSYVQQAQSRNPVASANAPQLTSDHDTCMGSTSLGAQGVGLGLSIGNTWHDDNCVMLKNSTMLWNMGKYDAAVALMCTNPKVREALEASGTDCPQARKKREDAQHPTAQDAAPPTWDTTDPYIARRMAHSVGDR